MAASSFIHTERRRDVLLLLGTFGPMRAVELSGWLFRSPSSVATADELTRRVLLTLLRDQLIIRRPNTLGGHTFVLTRTGRDIAQSMGAIHATDGYDSACAGVLSLHRSIGNSFGAFLTARTPYDSEFYNELQITARPVPADIQAVQQFLRTELNKIPDGVFKYKKPGCAPIYHPVEVENGFKKSLPIKKFLLRFYSKITHSPPELDIRLPLWACSTEEVAKYTYHMTSAEPVFYAFTGRYSPFEFARYAPP